MSRALGVVAKLAFFALVVVVGVFLFSRDFRRSLANRWAGPASAGRVRAETPAGVPSVASVPVSADGVHADTRAGAPSADVVPACADRVQADIAVVMPWLHSRVDRCQGIPTRATCSVETNARPGRRTAPVSGWDCSQRHINEYRREWVRPYSRSSAARAAETREFAAWTAQVEDELARGRRYVIEKMSERQQAIGEPDPYPRVVASPAR